MRFLPLFLAVVFGWAAALAAPVPQRNSVAGDPLSAFRIRDPGGIEQGPRWLDDFEQGRNIAAAQNSILLVLVIRDDCEFSRRMRVETLSDPRVWERLRRFALVEVNADRRPELAFQYRLRSTPTLLWLDSEGRELQRITGFVPADDLLAVMLRLLTPGAVRIPPEQARLIQELKATPNDRDRMVALLEALPRRDGGANLRAALRELKPAPFPLWVELLSNEKLGIRLGALELLEESAGNTFGFDPWAAPTENVSALHSWKGWIENKPATDTRFAPLTREQLLAAVRDLASDSSEHVQRATRALETGGPALRPHIEELLAGDDLSEIQRRRLNEVRLSLGVAALGWADAPGVAFRLRRGPLDSRMHLLRDIARQGPVALPVLAAFLDDPEILIRETVIEGLLQAGRDKALPLVLQRLRSEPNPDIALAAMRSLSKIANADASEWLRTQLTSGEEERVLGALGAMQAGKHDKLKPDAIALLDDSRWRVRAEAAEILGALGAKEALPILLSKTNDPDTFARSSILNACIGLSDNPAKKTALLSDWLKNSPQDFPFIVRIACGNHVPLPPELIDVALKQSKNELLDFLAVLTDCRSGWLPVALRMATHTDPDITAAALRLLASAGLKSDIPAEVKQAEALLAKALSEQSDDLRVVLVSALRFPKRNSDPFGFISQALPLPPTPGESPELDKLFGAFVSQTPASTAVTKEPGLDDLMGAFTEKTPEAVEPGSDLSLTNVLRSLLEENNSGELRLAAAASLLTAGDNSGLPLLLSNAASLDERSLETLLDSQKKSTAGLKLAESLRNDPRSKVRLLSVSWMARHAALSHFLPILDTLGNEGSELKFADIPLGSYEATSGLRDLKPVQTRATIQKWLTEKGEMRPERRLRQTMALYLTLRGRDTTLAPLLRDYAGAVEDPDLRAAAWITLAVLQRSLSTDDWNLLVRDPATAVRSVPAFLLLRLSSKSHTLKPSSAQTWDVDSDDVAKRWNIRIDDTTTALLESQRNDSMPEVRFLAGLALFTNNLPIPDPEAWRRDFPSTQSENELSQLFLQVIMEKASAMGTEEGPMTEWLTKAHGGEIPDYIAKRLKRSVTTPPLIAALSPTEISERPLASTSDTVVLVYIFSRDCGECETVAAYLESYLTKFPDLRLRAIEITDPAALPLYRAIYRQSGRPLTEVGLTPMLAGAGANDAGGEALTYDRIGEIIAASLGSGGESWIPFPREAPAAELIPDEVAPTPIPAITPPHKRVITLPLHSALLLTVPLFLMLVRSPWVLAAFVLGAVLPLNLPPEYAAVPMMVLLPLVMIQASAKQRRKNSSDLSASLSPAKKSFPWIRHLGGTLALFLVGASLPIDHWIPALQNAHPLQGVVAALMLILLIRWNTRLTRAATSVGIAALLALPLF